MWEVWKKNCAFELVFGLAVLLYAVVVDVVVSDIDAAVDFVAVVAVVVAVAIVVVVVVVVVVEVWEDRPPGEMTCDSPILRCLNLWVGDMSEVVYYHLEARVIYHTARILGGAN